MPAPSAPALILMPAPSTPGLIPMPAPSTTGLIPTVSFICRPPFPHTRENGYPSGD